MGEGNRQKSSGRKGGIREKNRGWKKIVALGEKIENTPAIKISVKCGKLILLVSKKLENNVKPK